MDLIYMNSSKEDVGVMKDFTFDLAFGADENDFDCTINRNLHCCEGGFFLYIEGTEYGGIIDDIKTDTEADEVVYHGRTWHGFLDSKCIVPLQAGEDSTDAVILKTADANGVSMVDKYLILSGEANKVLAWLIYRLGLDSLFTASTEDSGINIKAFQFDRYCMAYEGICKMLRAAGAKLKVMFSAGTAVIRAVPVIDYSQDEQFDSDLIGLTILKKYHPLNHLICLGQGELDERQVIHLYADSDGNISHTQSVTGIQEVTEVYDYSSVESLEELEGKGVERMQKAWNSDYVSTNFDSDSNSFDIGDIVGAKDQKTGIVGKSEITKKIVTINNNSTTISYKVGEE